MERIEIGKYLAADARVCGGRLIFKGTRILVSDAMEFIEAGHAPEDVTKQYRGAITAEAIREALTLIRKGIIKEIGPGAKTAA